jgi:hypothetical protein
VPLPLAARAWLCSSWLGSEIDPEAPERSTRLDDRSVADFCRVYLGGRALDAFLAPLFETAFGSDAAQTSRELLFALLDGRAEIGLDQILGAAALVDALAARAPEIRTGARVAAVDSTAAGLDSRAASARRRTRFCSRSALTRMRLLPETSPAERSAAEKLEAGSGPRSRSRHDPVSSPARVLCVPERAGGELLASTRRLRTRAAPACT